MQSLRKMLLTRNLGRVADRIESAARKSVRLLPGRRSADAASRLGGRPNLPRHFAWPTWREEPLAFVAQLDLATLPRVAGLALPRTGALLFFYEGGETEGFSPEDRGSSCVLYTPDPLGSFPLRSLPESLPDHLRFRGVQLSAEPAEVTVPNIWDTLVEQLALSRKEREAYVDFYDRFNEGKPRTIHRVGGYTDCIQPGDPKLQAHLVSHGLDCGESSGYKAGKKRALLPGASDWHLLLQVDSEKKAHMMWGDVGRVYFLIHKTELEQRRFDRTWVIFQCY
jgi:uncharacterized protein YwqG